MLARRSPANAGRRRASREEYLSLLWERDASRGRQILIEFSTQSLLSRWIHTYHRERDASRGRQVSTALKNHQMEKHPIDLMQMTKDSALVYHKDFYDKD